MWTGVVQAHEPQLPNRQVAIWLKAKSTDPPASYSELRLRARARDFCCQVLYGRIASTLATSETGSQAESLLQTLTASQQKLPSCTCRLGAGRTSPAPTPTA